MQRDDFSDATAEQVIQTLQGYAAFVPWPLPPSLPAPDWQLVGRLSDADRALSELAGLARNLPNPHLLITPFSRREAVASSRIEGTETTLSDLLYWEASPRAVPQGDLQEVTNYVAALEYGVEAIGQGRRITLALLKEMHRLLMRGVRGESKSPGRFRDKQNWIAGGPSRTLENARFVPPPPPQMQDALDALDAYLNAPDPNLPPLVRLPLLHYQFEAIHPFEDGNGRIGRILIILILCAERILPTPLLYLSAFFDRERDTYIELLLAVSQEGAWEEWIAFFLRGVAEQGRDGVARAAALLTLRDEYRARLQRKRVSAVALLLIDELFSYPAITIRRAAESVGITSRAAQQNIDKLMEEGILEEVTKTLRNRIFVAPAIIAIIEAPSAVDSGEVPDGQRALNL